MDTDATRQIRRAINDLIKAQHSLTLIHQDTEGEIDSVMNGIDSLILDLDSIKDALKVAR